MSERRQAARSGALTKKQTALIHVARKQLGLSDERYRYILRKMAGVESARDLDRTGFEFVMQAMAALGFRSEFTRSFYGHRDGMATPAQVTRIRALWGEYTEGGAGERSLDKWLERTCKVSALRFLTDDEAQKALKGLWAMRNRQKAAKRTGGKGGAP